MSSILPRNLIEGTRVSKTDPPRNGHSAFDTLFSCQGARSAAPAVSRSIHLSDPDAAPVDSQDCNRAAEPER